MEVLEAETWEEADRKGPGRQQWSEGLSKVS